MDFFFYRETKKDIKFHILCVTTIEKAKNPGRLKNDTLIVNGHNKIFRGILKGTTKIYNYNSKISG